jgi:DNA repair exonuclease SbcCD ATPase subunit
MDLDELLAGVRRQEEALLERQRNFRDLGGLNQRLQDLADSVDELYQDLEKARGQGTHRRASDVEESESELPAAFEKLSPRQLKWRAWSARARPTTRSPVSWALPKTP